MKSHDTQNKSFTNVMIVAETDDKKDVVSIEEAQTETFRQPNVSDLDLQCAVAVSGQCVL